MREEFKISDYLKKYDEKTKNYLIVNFEKTVTIHTLKQHL